MIIGITGPYCSGKDAAAEYLRAKGFVHISLSDILREEMKNRGMEITRDALIEYANELRRLLGPGILGELAAARMENGKSHVVTSIRSPAEVTALKRRGGFMLVNISAPAKTRFKRMLKRRRENDPATLQKMLAKEKKEKSDNPLEQQLHKVIAMADYVITNDSDIGRFHRKIDGLLAGCVEKPGNRPSWDEYFIGVSREVAKRATCDRGKSGCVIVKDKRILTTGYVGSPIGIEHCDDVGHEMHSVVNADGTTSKHCIRTTHAEQNAIVQAARYGIPISGATIYCKMEPCYICAKMMVNAGVKRVVCEKKYHGAQLSRKLFKKAGVKLEVIHDEIEKYTNQ